MYASAYAAKVFYDLENTLLRNGEKYIQQKISSTWKMEDTDLSTSLFEFSFHFIMVISGNQ